MSRAARIVIPGIAHHVTQRGNRRQQVFYCDEDYRKYLRLLRHFSLKQKTSILGWCLMPNHLHLILVPDTEDSLRGTLAPLHKVYSAEINQRENWSGHLWQDRYSSVPLDDAHTIAALRYVDLNPVRAGLIKTPTLYPWSSARAHLEDRTDGVVDVERVRELQVIWRDLLVSGMTNVEVDLFRTHERNGLPLGSDGFIAELEERTGKKLRPRKPGPPKGAKYRGG